MEAQTLTLSSREAVTLLIVSRKVIELNEFVIPTGAKRSVLREGDLLFLLCPSDQTGAHKSHRPPQSGGLRFRAMLSLMDG